MAGQQCSWASAEKRGSVVSEGPTLKPHKPEQQQQQQQLIVQLIWLPLYLALHSSSEGTSVPEQHLQSRQLLPGKVSTERALLQRRHRAWGWRPGPSLSIEERAELLGLGQTHTCRVNRKPTSQTWLSREAGVGRTVEEGEEGQIKKKKKKAGLTLIPVPPLKSHV